MNVCESFMLKSSMYAIISGTLKVHRKSGGHKQISYLWFLVVRYLIITILKSHMGCLILSLHFKLFQIFYRMKFSSLK